MLCKLVKKKTFPMMRICDVFVGVVNVGKMNSKLKETKLHTGERDTINSLYWNKFRLVQTPHIKCLYTSPLANWDPGGSRGYGNGSNLGPK